MGEIVSELVKKNLNFREFKSFKDYFSHFDSDIYNILNVKSSINSKISKGSTSEFNVNLAVERWEKYYKI